MRTALLGLALVALAALWALSRPTRVTHASDVPGHARMQMEAFAAALRLYRMEHRALPAGLHDLTGESRDGRPYLERIPLDPWGLPYWFRVLDRRTGRYELSSSGPDGTAETADDIHWPERESK